MYIALVKKMYIVNKKNFKKRKKKREITGVEAVALYNVVLWGSANQPMSVFY